MRALIFGGLNPLGDLRRQSRNFAKVALTESPAPSTEADSRFPGCAPGAGNFSLCRRLSPAPANAMAGEQPRKLELAMALGATARLVGLTAGTVVVAGQFPFSH